MFSAARGSWRSKTASLIRILTSATSLEHIISAAVTRRLRALQNDRRDWRWHNLHHSPRSTSVVAEIRPQTSHLANRLPPQEQKGISVFWNKDICGVRNERVFTSQKHYSLTCHNQHSSNAMKLMKLQPQRCLDVLCPFSYSSNEQVQTAVCHPALAIQYPNFLTESSTSSKIFNKSPDHSADEMPSPLEDRILRLSSTVDDVLYMGCVQQAATPWTITWMKSVVWNVGRDAVLLNQVLSILDSHVNIVLHMSAQFTSVTVHSRARRKNTKALQETKRNK